MRILTNSEQRQMETLKRELTDMPPDGLEIFISYAERETWLNLLDIIMQANDAMRDKWNKSDNPRIELRA